nr:MAG TPA: hypothetical protein [Bacteriophage sp.]
MPSDVVCLNVFLCRLKNSLLFLFYRFYYTTQFCKHVKKK